MMTLMRVIQKGVVIGVLFALGGCSTLFPPTAAQIQAVKAKAFKQRLNACNRAPFLIANLVDAQSKRVYFLKPGVMCYGK